MITALQGDCREVLASLADASVQCCVTSPPYYGLREYGTATWEGGDLECTHVIGEIRTGLGLARLGERYRGGGHKQGKVGKVYATGECPKCGAIRVDAQLGQEATPDAYIAELVAVFREVRRVLRDDGTVWLNLGDSYCSTDKWGGGVGGNTGKHTVADDGAVPSWSVRWRKAQMDGIKPKDMLQMPSRVAQALQAPYYTGRIKHESDRVWLAAMIDAEGCIYLAHKPIGTKTGRNGTKQIAGFNAGLSVSNTSRKIVERVAEIVGHGVIRTVFSKGSRREHFAWTITSNLAKAILTEIYPHLIAKQREARICVAAPSSGDIAENCWIALKAIHKGRDVSFDKPHPDVSALWEPGWYLRSDIIWHKPNPMPESVTDRPTSSHEHLFLLAKRAAYFFDAEAVREADGGTDHRRNVVEPVNRSNGHLSDDSGIRTADGRNGTGRNIRNVWTIATLPYAGAHFATFPPELAERCIKAGTSERGACPHCGAPWTRISIKGAPDEAHRSACGADLSGGYDGQSTKGHDVAGVQNASDVKRRILEGMREKTYDWQPSCLCPPADPVPCVVLDPFGGAGTTGLVADRLGRDATLIELSAEYCAMARKRLTGDCPLFTEIAG